MSLITKLSSVQKGIVVLTIITAVIHLALGISFGDPLFILNGVGYLALMVGLYFIPQLAGQRSLVRWALLAYAVLTIILYFFINDAPLGNLPGIITKLVELALVVLLWLDR